MNLEHLRTLLAVVDEGSFEDAAYALGITPSAVSQRIRTLEVGLGRTVLVRSRPVQPTESGTVLLRLARQQALLTADALAELGEGGGGARITMVINADSLATWALPPMVEVAASLDLRLEVRREDQALSVEPLRTGAAMAAITSVAEPVPGCSVRRLGAMAYHAVASPGFAERWFPDGATPDALAVAPVVLYDRDDDLQHRFLRRRTRRRLDPPVHLVPESTSFINALRLGLGWGLVAALQLDGEDLVELAPQDTVAVPLYWQQWKLHSPALAALAEALASAAARSLDQPGTR